METNFEVLVVETYFKAKKVDVSLLSDYFIKEQKETDSLNPKVFFAECEHAITTLKDKIDTKYMVRKEELTRFIMWAEANGDERSAELNKGELEFWSKDRVGIDLYDLTERLDWGERKSSNSINLQDFKVISEALEEARKIAIGREVPGIPTPPESKEETLTVDQIALYFHYLVKSKTIAWPAKKDWKELLEGHKFKKSHNTVYNSFKDFENEKKDILTLKNLTAIWPLLDKHPHAKKIAENDKFSLEND